MFALRALVSRTDFSQFCRGLYLLHTYTHRLRWAVWVCMVTNAMRWTNSCVGLHDTRAAAAAHMPTQPGQRERREWSDLFLNSVKTHFARRVDDGVCAPHREKIWQPNQMYSDTMHIHAWPVNVDFHGGALKTRPLETGGIYYTCIAPIQASLGLRNMTELTSIS